MKYITLPVITLCVVLATVLTETQTEQNQDNVATNSLAENDLKPQLERRKSARAVGDKPPRQKGVKELVYDLVKGTAHESEDVYRNISRIFLNTFTTTTTTPSPDDVDTDNSTTTTPASEFKITDFYRLAGINYRGLNRLFLTEFQLALKDSIKNVGEFRNDLRLSFFPFLRPEPKYKNPNITYQYNKKGKR
uniref:Uncharacterized protein n=1 Tax=Cacopsylla melanoneura TaxID=428564 RepID=A0A8D9A258_9HEMI